MADDGFHFLALNDTHYQDARCAAWLARAVEQMRSHPERPEFCLHLGDLVEESTPETLGRVKELFGGLGMPFHPVIGNHDYGPGDDPSAYDLLFPGRRNYRFEHRGRQFLGLDTTVGLPYENTAIPEATLHWLDATLPSLDPERPLILFTHFPLAPGVRYRPTNADQVLQRLKGFHVPHVFSGHFHGLVERRLGETVLTTNRCCSHSRDNHDGSAEKGYFLCKAAEGRVEYRFVEVRREA